MSQQIVELDDLRRLLAEAAGVSQGVDLTGEILDIAFQDLGYDSVSIMEIASRITSRYGVAIDDELLANADTPRRLLDLVNGR